MGSVLEMSRDFWRTPLRSHMAQIEDWACVLSDHLLLFL